MRSTQLLTVGALLITCVVACSTQDTQDVEDTGMTTEPLEPYELGTIAPLHTQGGVFLAGQPTSEDIALAKQAGMKTVINLRRPEEIEDFDEKLVVEAEGLAYVSLPIAGPDGLTDAVMDAAREHLGNAERPILLHCASANRVGAVWLPYRVLDEGMSYDEALAEAKTVGLRSPDYEKKAREYIEQRR